MGEAERQLLGLGVVAVGLIGVLVFLVFSVVGVFRHGFTGFLRRLLFALMLSPHHWPPDMRPKCGSGTGDTDG